MGYQIGVPEAAAIVSKCVEHGVNFFDNAEIYSNGQAEQIIGQVSATSSPAAPLRSSLPPHVNPSLSAQQAFKQLGLKRSEIVVSSKVFFGSGGACWRGRRQGAVGAAFATLCAHLWCPLACRQQRAHRQGPLSEAYRGRNQRCGACEGAASRPHPQHIAAGAAHACWCSPTLPRASPVQRTYLDSLSYPSHVSLTPLL